ncbi:MAG: hypothetical protein ACR650_15805 [Methylocystis sp.]
MILVVIQTLSQGRFSTYLTAAGYNQERAVRLYLWNAHVGEAFHTPIQTAEVSLRNSVNNALAAAFGPDWWSAPTFLRELDRERKADLDLAIRRINNRGIALITDQVVAGLSLGFWVGMLQPRYNPPIWSSKLRSSFPNLPPTETRDSLFQAAKNTAILRNRISHHEPIFKRDLLKDYAQMMKLISWICPTTHDWIRPHCRVPELMRQKPR